MFRLKDHPFAVEAFFDSSLVLTYAVPMEELRSRIPPCLELDTFRDTWGFVAAAFVQTRNLRPKGFPEFLGSDFFLTGFRIFVRYSDTRGRRLRGLYILKSETDKRKMSFWGNIFTHYHYGTTDITYSKSDRHITVVSEKSAIDVEARLDRDPVLLPEGSPFTEWKEARRFAGPLPFTFSYDEKTRSVLIIEGVRKDWIPRPVQITKHRIGYISQIPVKGMVLANAFITEKIPYVWKKGRIELWKA
jgi:uncharacterized protein YqjF (DUF2071 family)